MNLLLRKGSGRRQDTLPSTTYVDASGKNKSSQWSQYVKQKIQGKGTILKVLGLIVLLLLVQLWRVQLEDANQSTIHIPIDDKPDGVIPSLVSISREKQESFSDQKLRKIGLTALNQYGDQLRNLMLLGGEYLDPKSSQLDPQLSQNVREEQESSFRSMLSGMAPWLKGDPMKPGWPLNQFAHKPNSKAVLICAGDKMLAYLDAMLHTLFMIHQTKLPVYISYRGDPDLSPSSRDKLKSKFGSAGNLQFLDLTEKFNLDDAQINGWNLRPYGILAVPESEVAAFDVDVVLYRPPEDVFQIEGYKKEGAMFFHDRIACENCGLWIPRKALLALQPQPSPLARDTLKIGSEHIQESGLIVIDKSRRSRGLWGNLLLLGRWDVRRFLQRDYVYGDKETYWIAFESVNEPYAFARYWAGVVGNVFTDYDKRTARIDSANVPITVEYSGMALCGRLLHFDDTGVPLWSNGGYTTKEDDRETEDKISEGGLRPLFFVDGGDSWNEYENTEGGIIADAHMFDVYKTRQFRNQFWKFDERLGVNCMLPNSRGTRPVITEHAKNGLDAVDYYFNEAAKQ